MSQLSKQKMGFRPVYKVGDEGHWKKMSEPADIVQNGMKEIEAHFFFEFECENKTVPIYFAMCYPYSCMDLQKDLMHCDERMKNHKSIYYKREVLVKSYEGRRIDLLTITSQEQQTGKVEDRVHPKLFPEISSDQDLSKR